MGKIKKPYGILGYLKLISYTEIKKNFLNYKPLFIKKKKKYFYIKIKKYKKKKNIFLIKINNIKNRTKSIKFKNKKISTNMYNLPKIKNNYYWKDIIKCHIFTKKNKYLGKINNIITNKKHDILIIKKKKKILIPFIYKKIIKYIEIKKKIIFISEKYI
ncbi:ribosome maturation factor RimM [Buchnera aphidicola]|uniref:ribosome maturation factor RimM n=1 Tax=Buchnera aphidicola TaxID=9 RepID=UPI0031B8001A